MLAGLEVIVDGLDKVGVDFAGVVCLRFVGLLVIVVPEAFFIGVSFFETSVFCFLNDGRENIVSEVLVLAMSLYVRF